MFVSPTRAASYKPPKNFINKSWSKMSQVTPLKVSCVTTAGNVTPVEGLSEDDQKAMMLLDIGFQTIKSETEVKMMKKEKQMSAKKVVQVLGDAFNRFIAKEISYDDAAAQIHQTINAMAEFIVSPKGVFYSGTDIDSKVFTDKKTYGDFYKAFFSGSVTDNFDKKSMIFKEKKSKKLTYTGLYSKSGTDSMIKAITPSYVGAGPATVKLIIDEKNYQWGRSEAKVMIYGEKASFPIHEICEFGYAKSAAIIFPKNSQEVDANIGISEFSALLQALQ